MENGSDCNGLDSKSGTALHWSAYLGNEQATLFLLHWANSINSQDTEGLTPLHLAVMGGNPRIVKNLLIKGSNRNTKDKKDRTAYDIAKEMENTVMIKLLKPPGLLECLSFKIQLKPIVRTQ